MMIWTYIAFVGHTLNVIGEILVAFTVIAVHQRVSAERKIDEKVFRVMRRERKVAIWGILLIALGYVIQIPIFLPIFS